MLLSDLEPHLSAETVAHAREAIRDGLDEVRAFVFLDACRSQSLFSPRGSDPEIGPELEPAPDAELLS